jgi:hypothetical protein
MIKGELVGGDALIIAMRNRGEVARDAIGRAVVRLTIQLQRDVKGKLTDNVLRVRSGTLRRSINQKVSGEGSTIVKGEVGTNVVYGRFWEFGFEGTQAVKAHLRTVKKAFGRDITPTTFEMPAHTRNVHAAPHSFLRSALDELQPTIKAELTRAGKEIVK